LVSIKELYYDARPTKSHDLDGFKIWCWRRTENISWTDRVRNEEVLLRVKEQRNILHEIRKQKANCMGYSLCRNCLLKGIVEGRTKERIEVTKRRGKRRKQLLDDLKETGG